MKKNERGIVLITTYLAIVVLSVLALAFYARHNVFLNSYQRNQNKIIAFNMAESGLDKAMAELLLPTNNDHSGRNYQGSNGYVSMDTDGFQGGYSIEVCPPTCNGGLQTPSDGEVRIVRASGFAPSNVTTDQAYESRTVQAYLRFKTNATLNQAVFANDIKFAGGGSTDSYDSSRGAYNMNGNIGQRGDIATNSIAAKAITLDGGAVIKGNATVGPGGVPKTVINMPNWSYDKNGNPIWSNFIKGTVGTAATSVTYDVKTTGIESSPEIKYSGDMGQDYCWGKNCPAPLAPGTYRVPKIDISGNAILKTTGPVVIYVDGPVSISGGGVATSNNLPKNMIIYVTNNSKVDISGGAAFHGVIYAPLSKVSPSGGGQIYGAVIANEFDGTGGTVIHYDEDLKNLNTGGSASEIQVKSWIELHKTVSG